MKYLFIGDPHTMYEEFKQVVAYAVNNSFRLVCVGDYLDAYRTEEGDIERTKAERDQFKLLSLVRSLKRTGHIMIRGNHDISYLDRRMRCNGYQENIAPALKVKMEALKLPDYHIIKTTGGQDILVTHAGLSRKFVNQVWKGSLSGLEEKFEKAYDDFSNPLYRQGEFIKDDPNPRVTGRYVYSGPMWTRPKEFEPLEYYRQVFGHSSTGLNYNVEGIWVAEGKDSPKWRNINVDNFYMGARECLLYDDHKDEFSIITWEEITN